MGPLSGAPRASPRMHAGFNDWQDLVPGWFLVVPGHGQGQELLKVLSVRQGPCQNREHVVSLIPILGSLQRAKP